jgi:hypothetical protein
MGVLYIETCEACFKPKRRCCCSYCETVPRRGKKRPDPPPPGRDPLDEIIRRLAHLETSVGDLRRDFNGLVPTINAIREFINRQQGRIEAIRQFFEANVGEQVTVVATFDVIEGVVELVGVDAVVIRPSNDDIVIIPFTSVITATNGEGTGI